jgi:hypothetical protein
MRAYGHFKPDSTDNPVVAGDVVDLRASFLDLQSIANPLGTWWEGVCIDRNESAVLFELNPEHRGWHYGYVSNRFADDPHVFVVYFIREDQDGQLVCESTIESTPFKLVSQRRAKSRPQPAVPVPNPALLPTSAEKSNGWLHHLHGISKLPQNRGKQIRDQIRMAIESCDEEQHKRALAYSISKEVYKANAAGKTIQLALDVLKAAQPPPAKESNHNTDCNATNNAAEDPSTVDKRARPGKAFTELLSSGGAVQQASSLQSAEAPLLSDVQPMPQPSLEPLGGLFEGEMLAIFDGAGFGNSVFDEDVFGNMFDGEGASSLSSDSSSDPRGVLSMDGESPAVPSSRHTGCATRQSWNQHSSTDEESNGNNNTLPGTRPRKFAREERHLHSGTHPADVKFEEGVEQVLRIKAVTTAVTKAQTASVTSEEGIDDRGLQETDYNEEEQGDQYTRKGFPGEKGIQGTRMIETASTEGEYDGGGDYASLSSGGGDRADMGGDNMGGDNMGGGSMTASSTSLAVPRKYVNLFLCMLFVASVVAALMPTSRSKTSTGGRAVPTPAPSQDVTCYGFYGDHNATAVAEVGNLTGIWCNKRHWGKKVYRKRDLCVLDKAAHPLVLWCPYNVLTKQGWDWCWVGVSERNEGKIASCCMEIQGVMTCGKNESRWVNSTVPSNRWVNSTTVDFPEEVMSSIGEL